MIKWIKKKLTKNYTEVPIILVTFDYQKYIEHGEKGSCEIRFHPAFKEDEYIQETIKGFINHIREKYDMESIL